MDTSIRIGLQDDVSASARKISSELENVAHSADKITQEFDPAYLERYNQELNKVGENYTRLNQQITNTRNSQQQNFMTSMTRAGSGLGQGIVQAGSGDYAGGAISAGRGLSGLLTGLGPVGIAATAMLGVGAVGNALSKQYEARSPYAMRVSALENGFQESVAANTDALREAMASTVNAVSRYGKTFEEGAAAREAYLKSGGRDFLGTSQAAKYSTYYSADMGTLAQFEGMASLYGSGKALDVIRSVIGAQGIGRGRYEEVLQGTSQLFNELLSRGVIGNIAGLGATQAYFGQAGQTFQGGLGAQRLSQMNQALSGASGLGNQSDIFLYRAASRLAGGDLIQTKKLMEGGMTEDLFRGLMEQFGQFGYGKTESILQLSRTLGLSVTDAERLYGLGVSGERGAVDKFYGQTTGVLSDPTTRESQYIKLTEAIKQFAAGEIGAKAFDVKLGALGSGTDMIDFFKNLSLGQESEQTVKTINAAELNVKNMQSGVGTLDIAFFNQQYMNMKAAGYENIISKVEEARRSGVSEVDLASLSPYITGYSRKESPGKRAIAESEESELISLLEALIEATNRQTEIMSEPSMVVEP